jgi:DNA-binding XRE family transcriptional regulator
MTGGYKYQQLLSYLQRQDQAEITLTFAHIEDLIEGRLPDSARTKRAWWSNRSKGALQANAWMQAGYLVDRLDLAQETVTFRKPPSRYTVEWEGDTIKWNGELIRALRRHLRLSQTELADKIGVRQQTVSDWEVDAYDPSRPTSKLLMVYAKEAGFEYHTEPNEK